MCVCIQSLEVDANGASYDVTVILYVQLYAAHLISNEPDGRKDQFPGHSGLYCKEKMFCEKVLIKVIAVFFCKEDKYVWTVVTFIYSDCCTVNQHKTDMCSELGPLGPWQVSN